MLSALAPILRSLALRSPALRPAGLLACALALTLAAGCGGDAGGGEPATGGEPVADAPPAAESPQEPVADAAPAADSPSGLAPLSSRGTPTATDAPPPSEAAGLHFELPAGWQRQTPSSSMRLAQAEIPGPGGPAELTVFFFGPGGGGGREANIERWIGQMEVEGEPQRQSFDSNGLAITWVDVAGTMKPSTMGMGPAEPQPGYRLYGAVVEGPGGPWFFKATGPDETLAAARDDFLSLLQSLRPAA